MTALSIANANIYLSWICQELCIEPALIIQETDVKPNGYVDIRYIHFADVDGSEFAQDFKKLLNESFRHAKVYISEDEECEWFDLHITFKLDYFKKRTYQIQCLVD